MVIRKIHIKQLMKILEDEIRRLRHEERYDQRPRKDAA